MRRAALSISLVAIFLTGCGGGSGGSSSNSTVPPAPANLQSAQAPSLPIYVAGITLKATDSAGSKWSATYSNVAAGTSSFNQQIAYANSVQFAVSKESTVVDGESVTEFALMNPYSPLGLAFGFSTLPGRLTVLSTTSYVPLPATLKVGDSGPLISGSANSCCSFSQTYSVSASTPTELLLNIDRTFSDFGIDHGEASLTGLYSGSSVMTYSVKADGAATLVGIRVTINGTTLSFQ